MNIIHLSNDGVTSDVDRNVTPSWDKRIKFISYPTPQWTIFNHIGEDEWYPFIFSRIFYIFFCLQSQIQTHMNT